MSQVDLICIPPSRCAEVWPRINEMLRPAYLGYRPPDILHDLIDGERLLWVAADPDNVFAAAVTRLIETDDGKVCEIEACAGHDLDRWIGHLAGIEDYARREGAVRFDIKGRPGWKRALTDYRVSQIVLSKRL